jgi:ribose transport system ATP-binding protein
MLEFRNIRKSFFGVPVLKDVSFRVGAGRTVGLVGENGAGKSTLMNILGGNHRPDGGVLLLDGAGFEPRGPRDAAAAKVAFIHQELNLFPNLSIAENLFLTAFPRVTGSPLINRTAMRARARALLGEVELAEPPETLVEHLPAGERQLVEIAKALSLDARLIILDEPTTSLTARETARLFALMARLRERGIAMIYISHVLEDILRLCDDIVVLRDGAVVGSGPRVEFTKERIVSLMVGRTIQQFFPSRTTVPMDELVLEAHGLTQPGIVRNISFALRRGEVLGLAGLMGSGRSELAGILFGLDRCERGEVRVNGRPLRVRSPRECIRENLAFLTEDRRAEGLCLEASIADNLALVTLPAHASGPFGWLNVISIHERTADIRDAVRLNKSARDSQPAKSLSGGNQQKVVFAKWLLAEPSVLILDEPTRGIDIGAKTEIYGLINDLVARGAGVLVISSEIEELIGICDRILVLNRGELRDEIARPDFDRERILRAALHDPSA